MHTCIVPSASSDPNLLSFCRAEAPFRCQPVFLTVLAASLLLPVSGFDWTLSVQLLLLLRKWQELLLFRTFSSNQVPTSVTSTSLCGLASLELEPRALGSVLQAPEIIEEETRRKVHVLISFYLQDKIPIHARRKE